MKSTSEAPHLDEYIKYIDYEISQGEPTRILCLFERAIQDNCLNAELWVKYTKYLVCWHSLFIMCNVVT
jgi:hypothetical protein